MLISKLSTEFKQRRDQLVKKFSDAVFLFPAAEMALRNPDVHHPYRQDSNFYYLTGFDEAESFLVLTKDKMTLFVLPRDPEREMWEGERYGIEGAKNVFGADEAFLISDLDVKLPEVFAGVDRVFYRIGHHPGTDQRVLAAMETYRRKTGRSGKPLLPIEDPTLPLGEMRLFKQPDEIENLRKACQITAHAHRTVMKEARPGMNEGELEALIDYLFRKNGCQRLGYGSIVAGGKNAACLHYRFNNETLRDGDLVLIDAGGEYNYYTSDITRTFPVGKKFSRAQAEVYDVVLTAQKAAIQMAKPGEKLPDIHKTCYELITDGLLSLGLLKGKRDEIIKSNEFRRFFPHGTSHWLGMDVHDVGLYQQNGEPRLLEQGMVFTIEPGFYVQPRDRDVPREYQDIGIRIEDDVLITKSGCEVLTSEAPKEREEIEALRA